MHKIFYGHHWSIAQCSSRQLLLWWRLFKAVVVDVVDIVVVRRLSHSFVHMLIYIMLLRSIIRIRPDHYYYAAAVTTATTTVTTDSDNRGGREWRPAKQRNNNNNAIAKRNNNRVCVSPIVVNEQVKSTLIVQSRCYIGLIKSSIMGFFFFFQPNRWWKQQIRICKKKIRNNTNAPCWIIKSNAIEFLTDTRVLISSSIDNV